MLLRNAVSKECWLRTSCSKECQMRLRIKCLPLNQLPKGTVSEVFAEVQLKINDMVLLDQQRRHLVEMEQLNGQRSDSALFVGFLKLNSVLWENLHRVVYKQLEVMSVQTLFCPVFE